MALCPECDAELDVDEFDATRATSSAAPECGSNLHIVGLSPARRSRSSATRMTTRTRKSSRRRTEEVSDDEDEGGDDEDWDR